MALTPGSAFYTLNFALPAERGSMVRGKKTQSQLLQDLKIFSQSDPLFSTIYLISQICFQQPLRMLCQDRYATFSAHELS